MPKTIPDFIMWLGGGVLIVLSSLVLYFVKDMHTDFKAMQTKVESHEIYIATDKVEKENIKQSIVELKQKRP